MKMREILLALDWVLIGAVCLLLLVGLAMLFSSTTTTEIVGSRFLRQIIFCAIAIGAFTVVIRLPYHVLSRYVGLVYVLGLAGLLVVFVGGQVIRGTTSRLDLSGFQLQPSEFMKIAVVLALSWVLSRPHAGTLWRVGISALVAGVPAVFILLEPDLGVAVLLLILWLTLLVFIGIKVRILAFLATLGVAGFIAGWWGLFADYQKARLLVFLQPTRDPLGQGYNIIQSIVALGSGGVVGRGLGHGPQSQLLFLPERHTDFVLASIGEELGFIGVVVVILLYSIVLWRIIRIARSTQDRFGQLLAVSIFFLLTISFVVSAGMNMGLLPVTGIPLPLVSYGGSNLLSTFVLLGIVQSVHVYSKWVQPPPRELSSLT